MIESIYSQYTWSAIHTNALTNDRAENFSDRQNSCKHVYFSLDKYWKQCEKCGATYQKS